MTTTDQKTTASKTPSHIAYHVKDGNSGKGFWTRIGAAWAHANGNGFNIHKGVGPTFCAIPIRPSACHDVVAALFCEFVPHS